MFTLELDIEDVYDLERLANYYIEAQKELPDGAEVLSGGRLFCTEIIRTLKDLKGRTTSGEA
jgi:hypothetical protein